MHSIDLILTLTGGLTAALVFGYVTHRLGLSPIVGYLIGGTLLGPHTPGIAIDASLAEQMAEIGVILLMFGVGLQFHVAELLAVRTTAVPGALLTSPVAATIGYGIAIGRVELAGCPDLRRGVIGLEHGGHGAGTHRQP